MDAAVIKDALKVGCITHGEIEGLFRGSDITAVVVIGEMDTEEDVTTASSPIDITVLVFVLDGIRSDVLVKLEVISSENTNAEFWKHD